MKSMTGWAQAEAAAGETRVTVTIKAVNHRYLDLRWMAPAACDGALGGLEKLVRAAVARGHLDIQIGVQGGAAPALQLDAGAVAAYRAAWRALAEAGNGGPDPAEILRFPGVLMPAANNSAAPEAALREAMQRALEQLNQMRAREGEALAADLRARLDSLRAAHAEVSQLRERLETELLQRVRRRIVELVGEAGPPERLLQEAALAAERSDVGEELARLAAHLEQAERLLAAEGEVGKKFDFLLQEFNREVNTLLAKSNGACESGLRLTQLGLQMRADIEKLREQVQNVE